MNFGGGPSKKELQDLVETQRKQLLQYQTRLKDVVRAYKSLLKEKEALEASLHVLSTSQEPGTLSTDVEEHDDQRSTHSEDSVDTAGSLPSARGEETSEDERQEAAQHVGGVEEASGSESGVSTASGDGGPSTTADTDRRMVQLKKTACHADQCFGHSDTREVSHGSLLPSRQKKGKTGDAGNGSKNGGRT